MKNSKKTPLDKLRYHVSGAIERGEKTAIEGIPVMKHTPGPWEYGFSHPEYKGNRCCEVSGNNNKQRVALLDLHTKAVTEANARLIAAAPELLEACKLLVGFYKRTRNEFKLAKGYPDPSGFIENLDSYIPHLEDAINKAEGDNK